MGGGSTPKPEKMASVLQAYTQYLPSLLNATAATQPEVAQQQLAATQATQPGYNALNLQQAQQYALPLAQVGQQVQNSNALAGGATNLAQIQGTGGQAAQAAAQLAQQLNPNYYNIQNTSSQKAVDLLNSIKLGGLSGGEQAAVERSLARDSMGTGNLGLNNATNSISNAMNFGGAFNSKLGTLSNALNTANQTATSAQNTGFNPVNIALGQPNASTMGNFGTGTFNTTNAATQNASGNNAFGFGQGLMGNMTSMNNANTSAAASQSAAQMGMISSLAGTACCFIFLESYHGELPWYVRHCRDRYYRNNPTIAVGYKKMAKWLVPLMKRSKLVSSIVWHTMVKPLSEYGQFVVRLAPQNRKYKIVRKFWFSIWHQLGK